MREKIRKLIIERVNDFLVNNSKINILNNLNNVIKDEETPKRKSRKHIQLCGFACVVETETGYGLIFSYFKSIFKMEDYILDRTNTEVDIGNYSFIWTYHPKKDLESVKSKLFSVFPEAHTITIHDYTNSNIDFQDSKYVSKQIRAKEKDEITIYELFNDDLTLPATAKYVIKKNG